MNLLFLTMNPFTDIEMHNIYSDLMKAFVAHGHRPYIVTPREKKTGEKTGLTDYGSYSLLKVRIGNTSEVSLIEKGISTVTLSRQYYKAVKTYLGNIQFGLMLYSTPPITLAVPVAELKRHFGCRTYLMLKDIFPQNAVDLEMFGIKSPIYRYFRHQEKMLYGISDRIGCMSPANVKYVAKHNPEIAPDRIEICPNGIMACPYRDRTEEKACLRAELAVPDGAVVYLYGGNLGKPQGIPHLIECLKQNMNKADRFFIICGSGSEYGLLETFLKKEKPENIKLFQFLPKAEYDVLARGCDVGLIFLDARFTIPNYPSRILSYMENGMPVIVCSDQSTDVGTDAEENGYGYWCGSTYPQAFTECVERMNTSDIDGMGRRARAFLEEYFTAEKCYQVIMGELC